MKNCFYQNSDAWNHDPQHSVLQPQGKEAKGPPNQDHKVGDLEAMALGSSRGRQLSWRGRVTSEQQAATAETYKVSGSPSGTEPYQVLGKG